jgi:2',3'-cyclic-nucleotide 2'-phosphodiesterase (5'-nucleotidase family)
MAAHPPFVFDQNGNPLDSTKPYTLTDTSSQEAGVSRYVNNYNEQVTYINQKLLTTIDGILANSSTPPIIILQADHGPGVFLTTIHSINVATTNGTQ